MEPEVFRVAMKCIWTSLLAGQTRFTLMGARVTFSLQLSSLSSFCLRVSCICSMLFWWATSINSLKATKPTDERGLPPCDPPKLQCLSRRLFSHNIICIHSLTRQTLLWIEIPESPQPCHSPALSHPFRSRWPEEKPGQFKNWSQGLRRCPLGKALARQVWRPEFRASEPTGS